MDLCTCSADIVSSSYHLQETISPQHDGWRGESISSLSNQTTLGRPGMGHRESVAQPCSKPWRLGSGHQLYSIPPAAGADADAARSPLELVQLVSARAALGTGIHFSSRVLRPLICARDDRILISPACPCPGLAARRVDALDVPDVPDVPDVQAVHHPPARQRPPL